MLQYRRMYVCGLVVVSTNREYTYSVSSSFIEFTNSILVQYAKYYGLCNIWLCSWTILYSILNRILYCIITKKCIR